MLKILLGLLVLCVPLTSEAGLTYANDGNFKSAISQGVTLVDVYTEACAPCRQLAPILDQLAVEFQGKANIVKLDMLKARSAASGLRITSVPTLILFKNGVEVTRMVGFTDQATLRRLISSNL